VLIQHHEFGHGGSPDPMMFPYLIPPLPRYSESYVRVIALGRKQFRPAQLAAAVRTALDSDQSRRSGTSKTSKSPSLSTRDERGHPDGV
jgi:hypothetical protein